MDGVALLRDYWASWLAFIGFAVFHSICAHEAFKHLLARWTSSFFVEHFWRFIYCLISFVALYHIIGPLHWGGNPDSNLRLVSYPEWLWRVVLLAHLLSIVLLYVAFVQSDYLEFWGIKQMSRGCRMWLGRPAAESQLALFGTHRLVITGLYGWVRHPMLAAGLLFLLTSGPSRNNLVFLSMYACYMLLGAWYEEKRLVRIFGADYLCYRSAVGAFAPKFRRRDAGASH